MKKHLLLIMFVLLWAPPALSQEKAVPAPAGPEKLEAFEFRFFPGYRAVSQEGNARSAEYEYLHSSGAGSLYLEWDPLPHRFSVDSYYLNKKDFFDELDYLYRDIVWFNVMSRRMFHNLDHFTLGPDDPSTVSPSFIDRNPGERYGIENEMNKAFVRFKMPDFPFHIFAEARTVDREGAVQQRFLQAFSGGLDVVSQTRKIDWQAQEAKVGANSHLGPVEVEYSHQEKTFRAPEGRVLTEPFPAGTGTFEHNLAAKLESSSDTVKIHTSHSGRIAAAATYTLGEKENLDSRTKADFVNAGGDLTLIPWRDLSLFFKYRHKDVNVDTPDTVTTLTTAGTTTFSVRNAVGSEQDSVSGSFRYRATARLTFRGEYAWEALFRDVWPGFDILPSPPLNAPAFWALEQRIVRETAKLGFAYRILNRMWVRAEASRKSVDAQASGVLDVTYPDTVDAARATITWMPAQWLQVLLSGGTVIEERKDLPAPFAGSRDTQRDQALANITVVAGKKTSVTAGYAFFENRTKAALAFADDAGAVTAELGVPYADTVHVATLSAGYAAADAVTLTAEAIRSFSRGGFRVSAAVPGTAGIPQLSNIKVVESVYAAGIELRYTKNFGTDLRYQFRDYDDQLDNEQDGTTQIALATLTFRW
jgi:hypothetical protein